VNTLRRINSNLSRGSLSPDVIILELTLTTLLSSASPLSHEENLSVFLKRRRERGKGVELTEIREAESWREKVFDII